MFESLNDKLDKALRTLKGTGQITEINVAATVKEIRRALLDADVSYKVAKEITDKVKDQAMGQNVIKALKPNELFTKIVNDELTQLMGGQKVDINLKGNPAIILLSGLQGSGKTTFSGKLAAYLKAKGHKVLLTACDVYRPAAINQLQVLGNQIGVEVYAEPENKNPVSIAQNAINKAKTEGFKIVIVDTAGRLAIDEQMMDEIANVKNAIQPTETLFVVDAMTGQDAVNTAATFNQKINFDGVVLTKLDGDTRGGAALSVSYTVGKPIKFISTGEKMEAIDLFYPDRMANRILGMGDVVSLVERMQEQYNEEESRKIQKKIAKNKFDYEDFISQIAQIKKMGNIKDLMAMIPGVGKEIKNLDISNDNFKYIEAIIQSMTIKERQNPDLLTNISRRKRLAKGSGRTEHEVAQLVKQFDEMKKMMRKMQDMQKSMGGKMNMPFGR